MKPDFRQKLFMLFAAGMLGTQPVAAQPAIEVESRVDRSEILIGDVVRYSVVVTHDSEIRITMPPLAANLGQFEIRDYQVLEVQERQGRIVEQTDYLISTFDTGEFSIPPLEIAYQIDPDTVLYTLRTEPLVIQVKSLNPNEAGDIRDVKPTLSPDRDWRRWWVIGGGGLLLLLCAAAVIFWLRRRRKGEGLLPAFRKPPRPIHEVTLEALLSLRDSTLLAEGQIKAYYSELADIVRRYIQGRYYIDAPEMTTSQLQQTLQNERIEDAVADSIIEIMQLCDLVKFAKYVPEESVHDALLHQAIELVERTRLVYDTSTEAKPHESAVAFRPGGEEGE
ncbi:hypothetical protein JW992_07385 [candidate division KSB1 bacterium]|nr:hypothetical protein [candidate division KSB1 bacterium]